MSSLKIKEMFQTVDETSSAALSPLSAEKRNGGSFFDLSEILSARFDPLMPIGARGVADFYVGRELGQGESKELVALKVFTGHDERQLELFQLEATAGARLSHGNIIKSNPPEEIGAVRFCVMEHRSEAQTLKDLLESEGWLDPDSAIRIADQLAEALEYAHRVGVLHLAISAETILIDKDGTALLSDFGLERESAIGWAHLDRSCHGPIQYASPEQANGKPLDERSDLYSLGVVLYQMLTDRLPIDAENPDSKRQKRGAHSPMSPHLFSDDIPLSLSAVVNRLLEQNPSKRFQDAASVRVALEDCVGSPPRTDQQLSESLPSEVEEELTDFEQGPLDLEALIAAPARQSWEKPTITVINAPAEELAVLESESATGTEIEEPERPNADYEGATEESVTPIAARGLQPTRASRWQSLILPLIVFVTLASAAIGSVIVLARADRAKASNPEGREESPAEQGQEGGVNRTATPSDASEEATPGRSPSPGTEQARPSTEAGAGSRSARSAVRPRRIRALRPPVSTRLRQARRRSWTPEQYWRNYPYSRRR